MLAHCLFTNEPAICKTVKVYFHDRYQGYQKGLDRDAQKAMELRDEWLSGYESTDLLTRLLDIRAEDVDFLEPPADTFAAYVRYGKVYYDNLVQYGCVDWYDWRCEHWGTKWNAFDTQVSEITESADGCAEIQFFFDTAWSVPHRVFTALTGLYPNLRFSGSWFEEGISGNRGHWSAEGGIIEFEMDEIPPEMFEPEFCDWPVIVRILPLWCKKMALLA